MKSKQNKYKINEISRKQEPESKILCIEKKKKFKTIQVTGEITKLTEDIEIKEHKENKDKSQDKEIVLVLNARAPLIDEITTENMGDENKKDINDFNDIILNEETNKQKIKETTPDKVLSDYEYFKHQTNQINNTLNYHQNEINLLRSHLPVGTIYPYSKNIAPKGFFICNGRSLNRNMFSKLFDIIGTTFGSEDEDSFNIPDLRGKFIYCYNKEDLQISNTGGSKNVTLSNSTMPSHSHNGNTDINGTHIHTGTVDSNGTHSHSINDSGHAHNRINAVDDDDGSNQVGQYPPGDSYTGGVFGGPTVSATTGITINSDGAHTHTFTTASNGAHTHTFTTNNTGSNQSFSVINPNMALVYIIRHGVDDLSITLSSKGLTGDQGLTVGGNVTKDMDYENYTEEFDPYSYYPEFFPDMAPIIDGNIIVGDKDIGDKNIASYWNDLGNDVFDDWGYFYIYDVNSGKYYFPLFSPLNQPNEVLTTQVFNAFGRTFTIIHGFVAQGLFKFDISVNDNKPFRFGAYGNMGSDGDEVTAQLTQNYTASGNELTLYYHFHSEEDDSNEVLYSYFIPKLISENDTQTYSVFYDEDDMSMMSKEVTKGLLVYFSKKNDVKDWIINDLA
jgi:microcystin-dependent protein